MNTEDTKENPTEEDSTYSRLLEKQLKNLEAEKRLVDAERVRLEQELHSLRNEIDRLREPPLVGAVIIKKVRGELRQKVDKYLVMSSVGIIYCVNVNPLLKNIILESGMYVLLNQRTFAIMEVLSLTKEEVLKAADKLPHLYQVPEK